ncbi:GNAT family N-acetyltransferase [Stenotrophomonas maltophilia]|uniref:GNAT family N-acetyltransferase n=1 Tax=Stenotrophomonas forensis TaxID=2871169 RepID=A0ABY7XWP9_9GAMM|nr:MULTISPECIES: GNAT family N-acetyltransferase [Stenotrophomonas]ALA82529.1 GCN5 family acetyltransferase [Stenotrophomonas maltophilia]MBH1476025.1 GNAT family N-acetyltransferase [Stenotrophomonas maltophilia]MBH1501661.1 GNAT family N-acetyltransferase [Stenotrophomonas maltophilia]MBH1784586.1 GNAT family N-acetyltransferase [Stenotrophomonas maltophilia]WDM61790.1 GNAT family N-acetyltransferase [Stenotrophomonas sp. DFS-20110405]
MEIRAATAGDFDAMWAIFRAAIATEDALPFAGTFEASTFQGHWFGLQPAYVALLQDHVVGMYKMGANFPDLGAHVASATYVVDPTVQGRGIGRVLVEHSLERARAEDFLAMQFNYVVSTNAPAVALYRKLGFAVVGALPEAFRHRTLGLVDVFVMHRFL